jgi:hypothetical protein
MKLLAIAAALLGLVAVALAGCGARADDRLPPCSTGRGVNGDRSTLRITQDGDHFTGTYDVTPAGEDIAIRYVVDGTARDGRLQSTWALGSAVLTVTGRYTAREVTLDNPGGKFSTTRFVAGCPGP